MSIVLEVLTHPAVHNLIFSGLGLVATYVIGRVGVLKLKEEKRQKAYQAIMASCNDLYELALDFKKSNENNKLTNQQRTLLNNRAIEKAQKIGMDLGIDVIKILGPDLVKLAITQSVKSLKSKHLPEDVLNLFPSK